MNYEMMTLEELMHYAPLDASTPLERRLVRALEEAEGNVALAIEERDDADRERDQAMHAEAKAQHTISDLNQKIRNLQG